MEEVIPAQWLPDPTETNEFRYWDGANWTNSVSNQQLVSSDQVDVSSLVHFHALRSLHRTLIEFPKAAYLGGTSSAHDPCNLTVRFTWAGIIAFVGVRASDQFFQVPWADVSDLIVADQGTMETRITATRILAVGVLALAIPKKSKNSFLAIRMRDGSEWIFRVTGSAVPVLRSAQGS